MPVALRIVTHVSYVMRIHHDIVAGAAFGEVHVSLFVAGAAFGEIKFMCHFSWQAQHVVKFGMIAGAGNVVIFNGIWSWRVRKVASVARRVAVCVFLGRIMVESFSDILGSVARWKWHCSCFP